jgi:hypothetical protein
LKAKHYLVRPRSSADAGPRLARGSTGNTLGSGIRA